MFIMTRLHRRRRNVVYRSVRPIRSFVRPLPDVVNEWTSFNARCHKGMKRSTGHKVKGQGHTGRTGLETGGGIIRDPLGRVAFLVSNRT